MKLRRSWLLLQLSVDDNVQLVEFLPLLLNHMNDGEPLIYNRAMKRALSGRARRTMTYGNPDQVVRRDR